MCSAISQLRRQIKVADRYHASPVCADGKLYVAAVLDCYNGEIIGLAMDNNMRKELCIHAFCSACQAQERQPI